MIGIFDSGIGGLTVLEAVRKKMPEYGYLYLGDSARSPYGDKTAGEIYAGTEAAVSWLFDAGAELVVLACNTASARALRRIQQEWLPRQAPGKRALGVVIPIAEAAAARTKNGRIGVIGTRSTIRAGAYEAELRKAAGRLPAAGRKFGRLAVYGQACPLLVPLVEKALAGSPGTKSVIEKYLYPLKRKKIDVLILGCTHYPFLKKDIVRTMGKDCEIPDTGKIVADKLAFYLKRHPEIERRLDRTGKCRYFTSGDPDLFCRTARIFLRDKKISARRAMI